MLDAVSAADLARLLGVKPAAIAALESEGLPANKPNGKNAKMYPLARCFQWYCDYCVRKSAARIPSRSSKTDFAALIGVTTRQVTNLVEQGLPTIVDGNSRLFPLPSANHWYLRLKESASSAEELGELDKAKLRKLTIETEQAEHALLRIRGESLGRLLVERLFGDVLQTVRGELLNMPAQHSEDLHQAKSELEHRQKFKMAVHETLSRLGKAVAAVVERLKVSDDDATTADADDDAA